MTSLHTHSWYSLLEGANSPEALVEQSVRLGNTSLALTDTNNLYGIAPFLAAARSRGIKPLLGATLRHAGQEAVALIGDSLGYTSLCRILSRVHLHPGDTTLADMLTNEPAGLHLLVRDPQCGASLREAFGDRVWVEVVRPNVGTTEGERRQLEEAKRLGLPVVASTAAHFAEADDYRIARVAAAVRLGKRLDELPATLSVGPAHRLVSGTSLRWRFRDVPDAVNNAERLADLLTGDPLPRDRAMPGSIAPKGVDEQAYLASLCERGLRKRGLDTNSEARARLNQELLLIAERRLAAHLLIIADIARFARRRRHPSALRGPAANSLACYLLEITDINPLRFGLAIDRFLRPGSMDRPDIALDFDPKVRDEAIDYLIRGYGRERTGMISSHVFFQPRTAFRESAAIHGLSPGQIETLCESLGPRVEWMLRADPNDVRLRSAPRTFPFDSGRWGRILHDSRRLLDRPHHLGVRPGGIAIAPDRLDGHVPLEPAPEGGVVTQFDQDGVVAAGLVKIDLLANRALGMADELQGYGFRAPRIETPAVFDLLRRGDTLGIALLESPAMRHVLVQTAPDRMEDVAAALALVRPAMGDAKCAYVRLRRSGKSPTLHPRMQPVLGKQRGVMIFEDDAIRTIEALTGMSLDEAYAFFDRLRKSDSDAAEGVLADELFHRCGEQGVARTIADEQFAQMLRFRQYGLSKSQAVSYGMLAMQAAAHKVRHPAEFWAAALNNQHEAYPRRVYIEAIKQAGIRLLPPCVNRSHEGFTVEDRAVRVGLDAVGALPAEMRERLLANRRDYGAFRGLADFVERVKPTRAVLSALIRCAAFDFADVSRDCLYAEAKKANPPVQLRAVPGSLFGDDGEDELWTTPDAVRRAQLFDELATLGFVLGPPMLSMFADLLPEQRIRAKELPWHAGETAIVAGVPASVREGRSEDGRLLHIVTLQDETGLIDLKVNADALKAPSVSEAGPYFATGIVCEEFDVVTLQVQQFEKCRAAGKKKRKSNAQHLPNLFGETVGGMPGIAS
ncbi:MAG: PHP domain-containing protein [Gemmataceae bacterium]|nr:PHP domain-containing protein [Gemmataceae bacterium]